MQSLTKWGRMWTFFFFSSRRRHTRCGRDWSSDVCSSDLAVRPGAGAHLPGLTASQRAFFDVGSDEFQEVDGLGEGLGPRFNLDSCVGCHSQPAVGGTSPVVNPQVAVATAFGARNTVPPFITRDGPVREARFKRKADGTPDGGVHW